MTYQFPLNIDASYLSLPDVFYQLVKPETPSAPQLLLYNDELGKEIGLPYKEAYSDEIKKILSGQSLPSSLKTFAQAYAGHQFGHFNMLGDGRAIMIGEHLTPDQKRIDLQLKGAGRTTYSRRGDGKATLSAMLREYLISEAMYHLNIPTSRSLAVVLTGETVMRQRPERGAVLTRIASSHIRVGTFEFAYQQQDLKNLKQLADYTITRHFPSLKATENPYLSLIKAVINLQIDLVTNWMRVGFIHGVLNTDNISIAGETIDYGPCAFMNRYDPKTVFSSIDTQGRYAFGNQAKIMHWNLTCFAGAMLPLVHENEKIAIDQVQQLLNTFPEKLDATWSTMMASKLGFTHANQTTDKLAKDLLKWMLDHQADYTNTFLDLQSSSFPKGKQYDNDAFKNIHASWLASLEKENSSLEVAQHNMKKINPSFIPRNHLVEKALSHASEELNFDLFNELIAAYKAPYDYDEKFIHLTVPPADDDKGYQTFCGT